MGTIEQSCTFYQHPFRGPFLMFDTHAPVQTQSLFDHRVDAALETAGGFRAACLHIGKEMVPALEFREQVVRLPESVVRLPPFLPGG